MPIPCSHNLFAQTPYFFFNSLVPLLCQGQQITSLRWLDGKDALKETKNQSRPLPLSTPVFSWVEEAADVGKQGCNTQHGDANDVGVGTHVAKRALTAASRLHLHGWCAQRLLQRSASCSRTGSGAHKAEHRGACQSQEHASEHTWAGASHVASFGTKRAAQERPSKSSSSSQKHCGVRCTPTTMNIPSNEQNWSSRWSPTKELFFCLQKDSFDRILWSPNKHALNPGPITRRTCQICNTCLSPVPICSLQSSISSPIRLFLCSVRGRSHPSDGWMGRML